MIDGSYEVPRHLLELFSGEIAVSMLRHPRATIESSLGTFKPRVMAGAGATLDLEALRCGYAKNANRWQRVVTDQPAVRDALAVPWPSWKPRLASTMRRAGYADTNGD